MTKPIISKSAITELKQYLTKIGLDDDADFLRKGVQLLSQMLMEVEVEQQTGAGKHERTPERSNYRNGYRERTWETRVGEVELAIPKLRKGSYFPSLLEPRRPAEKALLAVVQEAYLKGVSTRKVDALVKALGLTGIDKSRVSRICKELDQAAEQFRHRPLQESYPYVWLDALYLKVRQNHRIVSLAMVIAIAVDQTRERHLLGFDLGASEDAADEDKTLWINEAVEWKDLDGQLTLTVGAVTWFDDGSPWAVFSVDEFVKNVEVSEYVRKRGP